jgi:hypothetical protein
MYFGDINQDAEFRTCRDHRGSLRAQVVGAVKPGAVVKIALAHRDRGGHHRVAHPYTSISALLQAETANFDSRLANIEPKDS